MHSVARSSLVALLLLPASFSLLSGCGEKKTEAKPAPPDVEVVPVQVKDVQLHSEWVATTDGYINAQIQPKVSGYLQKQNYVEGALVKKNQVLFQIDARPYVAALEQAKGQVAKAEAELGKTEQDVKRDTPLAQARAIPQAQLDNDIQANLAAKALLQSARADMANAQLNVEYTNVRSLIDGIAGIAKGQIGDLVQPNTLLTTVSKVDPIKVYFSISEQEYLRVAQKISQFAEGRLPASEQLPLQLVLGDGTVYPHTGRVLIADRQVDPRTGTIRIAAVFPNPKRILRPGQFGRVRAPTSLVKNAILVPQRAVTELQGSYQVAVVGDQNKVDIRPVKVGDRFGDKWIV